MAERVSALREVGLFADRSEEDEALATVITAAIAADWGPDAFQDDPLLDLVVAEQDRSRVWWQDLEADVSDGNEVYVGVLTDLASISVGAFAPSAIEESWQSDSGPVTISFEQHGQTNTLAPAYIEDWIDPGILAAINELIVDSGRRFELYKAFDQTALAMALTEPERRALEARGWCFE
jgi:hypothetical protein